MFHAIASGDTPSSSFQVHLVVTCYATDYELLLNNIWSIIVSAATIMNKRAQFLIVKIGSQKVGLMNLCAPNSTSERAGVWSSLCDYASLADCWLVEGDFNIIEDVVDRMGGITTTISGWEAKCRDYICFA